MIFSRGVGLLGWGGVLLELYMVIGPCGVRFANVLNSVSLK